jgi:hypothetical protein
VEACTDMVIAEIAKVKPYRQAARPARSGASAVCRLPSLGRPPGIRIISEHPNRQASEVLHQQQQKLVERIVARQYALCSRADGSRSAMLAGRKACETPATAYRIWPR